MLLNNSSYISILNIYSIRCFQNKLLVMYLSFWYFQLCIFQQISKKNIVNYFICNNLISNQIITYNIVPIITFANQFSTSISDTSRFSTGNNSHSTSSYIKESDEEEYSPRLPKRYFPGGPFTSQLSNLSQSNKPLFTTSKILFGCFVLFFICIAFIYFNIRGNSASIFNNSGNNNNPTDTLLGQECLLK